MTFASGMRVRKPALPTDISHGGTGATTRVEAVAALGVPSLEGDNVFTGQNTFGTVWASAVKTDGDLTFLTTDVFNFEDGGGTNSVEFLGAGRSIAFPDASGTLMLLERPTLPYRAISGTDTAGASDGVLNATSGTFTLALPAAASLAGRVYYVKNSGAGVVTLDGDGAETIDGAGTLAVAAGTAVKVICTGSGWVTF